jgi:hypothetical protein
MSRWLGGAAAVGPSRSPAPSTNQMRQIRMGMWFPGRRAA